MKRRESQDTVAKHEHEWLDNYGKNLWDEFSVYLQEKNNSVWKATLNIANDTNGRKILYDIDPIKKVEGASKSAPTSTNNNVPQDNTVVNSNSMQNSENNAKELHSDRDSHYLDLAKDSTLKITPDMPDNERSEVLKNSKITLAEYDGNSEDLNGKNVLLLKSSYNSQAVKILKSLGEKFGVFKTYSNENVTLDFDYSRSSLNESVHKQGDISTDFYDFAKMLYVFDDVVKNAVPIEAHTDKYKGTKRENTNLKQDLVLLSAFKDGAFIVPVEFHIKEMNDNSGQDNRLYVSVTLGKIKIEETIKATVSESKNNQTKGTPVSSTISIPELISKINPEFGNFYKYIPSSMLNQQQNNSKSVAVEDEDYRLKVMRGEDVTSLLKEKALKNGYDNDESWKMDHRAPNATDGYSNSIDKIDKSYGSDGSIYSSNATYYYGEGREYDGKAIAVIRSAKNNPEKMIKVFRAVPNSVKDTRMRNGDWVSIVKEYVQEHSERVLDGDYRIIEDIVPAKHLYSNGDSINEWGYDNGNEKEVYSNTENNVKLLDVTYDDNGNVIPLSERFNESNNDIRYSERDYWYPDMTKSEISYVRAIAKREVSTTENYIDNSNKWLYNEKSGVPYFALYSTENVDEPTILYACKEQRAKDEQQFVQQYINYIFGSEVENLEYVYAKTGIINQISQVGKNTNSNGVTYRGNVVGRGSNGGNASVYSRNRGGRPSKALLNCLQNFGEIREQSRTISTEDSESGISFSERDPDALTNRQILAEALETATQNGFEKELIEKYKSKIDFLDEQESKLKSLKAQIS